MTILIPLAVFVLMALLWPVFAAEKHKPSKVYPLSPDDAALRKHFVDTEKARAKDLRKCSEAIRRRYEGITWPAMCWEVRQREILRHLPTMRQAS